jgi:hypothetical protein
MQKTCQNCKNEFNIDNDDKSFYQKIEVPEPTLCPECRLVRRMSFSNELRLYKRTCDLTGKNIISIYHEDEPFPVYDYTQWNGDGWDPQDYAMEYDFSRPFFEQFKELKEKVPRPALVKQGSFVNSDYTNRLTDAKNCYMIFRATTNEGCMYSYVIYDSMECVDCFYVHKCELCYECIGCSGCYKTYYSEYSNDCRDSYFLYNCFDCSDCFGCVNLRNKQYYIFNEPYSKEEYKKKLDEFSVHNRTSQKELVKQFEEFKLKFPRKYFEGVNNSNVSGNWIFNCKNTHQSFFCDDAEDCKFLFSVFSAKTSMDYYHWGKGSELMYEVSNCGINCFNVKFCNESWSGTNTIEYCDTSIGAKNCFGCVGLRNGEYCILNKQYSKEEYEELLPKIKQHMNDMPYIDSVGREYKYGEFFPVELAPCAYNETAAQEYFPLTKKEALEKGFKWRDLSKNQYNTTKKADDLPDTIKGVDDAVTQEIIECGDKDAIYSPGAYRITPQELDMYRKLNVPLPQYSFDVRHRMRMQKIHPIHLWKRTTDDGVEVMTPYAPDRPERILSEEGYQKEVL